MPLKVHQLGSCAALAAVFAAALAGLPETAPGAGAATPAAVPAPASRRVPVPAGAYADLSDIRFEREFRILVVEEDLPESDVTTDPEAGTLQELIERFAEENFLLPLWIPLERREDLLPALRDGEGDLIGTPMLVSEFRKAEAGFSMPVAHAREVLVGRDAERIDRPQDLRGRQIAIAPRSTFWPRLIALTREVPDIEVRILPEGLPTGLVLEGLRDATFDLAVLDPGPVELGKGAGEGLQAVAGLASSGSLSLGLHADAIELRDALDDFLASEQLAREARPRRSADLDGIARSGVLRVLTRNNAGSYFIWRGKPLGFDYELISRFARKQKLSVEMIIVETRDELLPALLRGEGDVVAATLPVPSRPLDHAGVTFTRPYLQTFTSVVTRDDDTTLIGPTDLIGRTVTMHRSNPAWALIESLRAEGLAIRLEEAPSDIETDEIIARVASGVYDVTVADDYAVKVALTWRDDVRSAFALQGPMPVAWAVRDSNPDLRQALNAFIKREYRQVFYNIVHARYFENARIIRTHMNGRADLALNGSRLSPYDDLVKHHAERYGFDWTLILALMYRESRFKPDVVSWAGARGLMQLLPTTAKRFGVNDPTDPESSIIAGVRMLRWLFDRMEPELSVADRTWFALAAYNAGLGHLLDARRLARAQGLDPNRWFDNVEKAMLLLSKPTYYRKARHGYVRGIEPVTYVRDIRALYNAYRATLPS